MLQVTSLACTTTPPEYSVAAEAAAVKEGEEAASAGERTRSLAGGRETGREKVRNRARRWRQCLGCFSSDCFDQLSKNQNI